MKLGDARSGKLADNLTVWENLWMAENAPAHRAEAGFLKRWIGGRGDARERIGTALAFSGLTTKEPSSSCGS